MEEKCKQWRIKTKEKQRQKELHLNDNFFDDDYDDDDDEQTCDDEYNQDSLELFEEITGIEDATDYDINKFLEPTAFSNLSEESRHKLLDSILQLQVGCNISQRRIVNRNILAKFIKICIFFIQYLDI